MLNTVLTSYAFIFLSAVLFNCLLSILISTSYPYPYLILF